MQEFVAECINFAIMIALIEVLSCTSHTESSGIRKFDKSKANFHKGERIAKIV